MDSFTVTLAEPVMDTGTGAPTTTLTLRPPTGMDFLEAGYPYKLEQDLARGEVRQVFDTKACRLLLARMALVPSSTIDRLCAYDYCRLLGMLPHFLARPNPKTGSTPPSTSDTSSAPTPPSA